MSETESDKKWEKIKEMVEDYSYNINIMKYDKDSCQIIWRPNPEIVLEGNMEQTLNNLKAITMIENQFLY